MEVELREQLQVLALHAREQEDRVADLEATVDDLEAELKDAEAQLQLKAQQTPQRPSPRRESSALLAASNELHDLKLYVAELEDMVDDLERDKDAQLKAVETLKHEQREALASLERQHRQHLRDQAQAEAQLQQAKAAGWRDLCASTDRLPPPRKDSETESETEEELEDVPRDPVHRCRPASQEHEEGEEEGGGKEEEDSDELTQLRQTAAQQLQDIARLKREVTDLQATLRDTDHDLMQARRQQQREADAAHARNTELEKELRLLQEGLARSERALADEQDARAALAEQLAALEVAAVRITAEAAPTVVPSETSMPEADAAPPESELLRAELDAARTECASLRQELQALQRQAESKGRRRPRRPAPPAHQPEPPATKEVPASPPRGGVHGEPGSEVDEVDEILLDAHSPAPTAGDVASTAQARCCTPPDPPSLTPQQVHRVASSPEARFLADRADSCERGGLSDESAASGVDARPPVVHCHEDVHLTVESDPALTLLPPPGEANSGGGASGRWTSRLSKLGRRRVVAVVPPPETPAPDLPARPKRRLRSPGVMEVQPTTRLITVAQRPPPTDPVFVDERPHHYPGQPDRDGVRRIEVRRRPSPRRR